MTMPAEDGELSLLKTFDDRLEVLEQLALGGHRWAIGMMRSVAELRAFHMADAAHFEDVPATLSIEAGWVALNMVDAMIDNANDTAVTATSPPMPTAESTNLGRLIAADVLELKADHNGEWDYHQIFELKVSARRLLTGVDEGPYTGRKDSK